MHFVKKHKKWKKGKL